jgi:hypothetical protein
MADPSSAVERHLETVTARKSTDKSRACAKLSQFLIKEVVYYSGPNATMLRFQAQLWNDIDERQTK